MVAAREFLGFIMAAIFTTVALMMMIMAWLGLDHVFGWKIAAAALVFSMFMRVNLYLLAGVYLFSAYVWFQSPLEAILLTLPGLMFITPTIATALFTAVSRPDTHY